MRVSLLPRQGMRRLFSPVPLWKSFEVLPKDENLGLRSRGGLFACECDMLYNVPYLI